VIVAPRRRHVNGAEQYWTIVPEFEVANMQAFEDV
jgi:hypothetical protein